MQAFIDAQQAKHRFVVRGEEGELIEVIDAKDRAMAIRLFCYPALVWDAFERAGWSCAQEDTPRSDDQAGLMAPIAPIPA